MIPGTKLGIGTAQFGMHYGISNIRGKTSPDQVQGILDIARKYGINTIDTAAAYGNAEQRLGETNTGDFLLIGKFLPGLAGGEVPRVQLQNSLSILNRKSLYGYLAHCPQDLLSNHSCWEEFETLKDEGYMGKIGYSLNDPNELTQLLDAGMVPELVQLPYNYLDRRFEEVIKILNSLNCEVHARSSFLQGLLFLEPATLNSHFDPVKPILEELQKKIPDLPAALLAFSTQHPEIHKVIIGIETPGQLLRLVTAKEVMNLPELREEIPETILNPSLWPKS